MRRRGAFSNADRRPRAHAPANRGADSRGYSGAHSHSLAPADTGSADANACTVHADSDSSPDGNTDTHADSSPDGDTAHTYAHTDSYGDTDSHT